MKKFITLILHDIKITSRDPLMLYAIGFPIFFSLLLRWLVAKITFALSPKFELTLYYPLISTYFSILMTPLLFGMTGGFATIDERDDKIISALCVTPLSLRFYFGYRLISSIILSIILIVTGTIIMGIFKPETLSFLAAVTIASLQAPIWILFLSLYARNKVEGLALIKAVGSIFLLGPVISYFIPLPWKHFFGIIPTYWHFTAIIKMPSDPVLTVWKYLFTGMVFQTIILLVLIKQFTKKIFSFN